MVVKQIKYVILVLMFHVIIMELLKLKRLCPHQSIMHILAQSPNIRMQNIDKKIYLREISYLKFIF